MTPMIPIALALAFLQGPTSHPPRVMDGAKMFSESAASRAAAALDDVGRETGWDVAVKTVPSLASKSVKDEAIAAAKAAKIHGLYLLFSKGDRKFHTVPSPSASQAFPREAIDTIDGAIAASFKAGKFDDGLEAAVAKIRALAAAHPAAGHRATANSSVGASPVGVRDRAKLFTPEAVKQADDSLRAFQRETKWQVVVETIESLAGQDIVARARADAKAADVRGLFVLIAKNERKFEFQPSDSARKTFTPDRIRAMTAALNKDFSAGKFDQGLRDTIAEIRRPPGSSPEVALASPKVQDPKPVMAHDEPKPSGTTTTPGQLPKDLKPFPPTAPEPAKNVPAETNQGGAPALPGPLKNLPPVASNLPMYIGIGIGILFLLWILSRAFGSSRSAPNPNAYASQAPAPAPPPGYGPAQANRPPTPQAGYGPPPRPAPPAGYGQGTPPPGYGQPGYGQPGYGQPGYGPPPGYAPGYGAPPQQGGGGAGGFVTGALGGLGGAIAGNILYDKFGRPHEGHSGGHVEGHASGSAGFETSAHPTGPQAPIGPQGETYDPNAGGGGSWDAPAAESPAPADEWAGQGDAGGGGDWAGGTTDGGDWGQPQAPPDQAGGDWGAPAPDTGGGGDWGAPAPDTGGGGDWGAPAPDAGGGDWSAPAEEAPASDWSAPADDSGGGDWGGGGEAAPDQEQGGNW